MSCLKKLSEFFSKKNKDDASSVEHIENKYSLKIEGNFYSFPSWKKQGDAIFVGRDDELHDLASWISSSNLGSVLVSGVRGIGKTAFVYRALAKAREVEKKDGDSIKEISPIFIDGSTIQPSGKPNDLELLKKVITSCFYSLKLDSFKKLNDISIGEYQKKEKSGTELSVKLKLSASLIMEAFFTLFFFFLFYNFILSQFNKISHYSNLFFGNETTLKISLSLVFSIGLNLVSKFILEQKFFSKKVEDISFSSDNPDYLSALLKYELSRDKKKKYLFIVDELDKLDTFEELENVIKSIKNTITISDAQFIFICDDAKYYEFLKRHSEEDPYPMASTYFNWDFFLTPLSVQDIKTFLRKVLKVSDDVDVLKKIDEFAYFVYSESGGIPSRIKSVVKDFMQSNGDGSFVNLSDSVFDEEKIKQARLAWIFETLLIDYDYVESSKKYLNHATREILFFFFRKIMLSDGSFNGGKSITDFLTESKNPAKVLFPLLSKERELLVKVIQNLFSDINKYAFDKPLNNVVVGSSDKKITFSVDLSTQVVPRIDDLKRDDFTDLESKLIEDFKSLVDEIETTQDQVGYVRKSLILSLLDKNYLSFFDSIKSVVDSLTVDDLFDQSKIRQRSSDLLEIKKSLTLKKNIFFQNYLKHILSDNLDIKVSRNLMLTILNKENESKFEEEINIEEEEFFINLVSKVKNHFKNDEKINYFGNWKVFQIEKNGTQRFDFKELKIDKKFKSHEISFKVQPQEDYWRVGLSFGQKGKIPPLRNSDYSLCHFHKDIDSDNLYYARYKRNGFASNKGLQSAAVRGIKATDYLDVSFNLFRKGQKVFGLLKINGVKIDEFAIPTKDLNSSAVLSWVDKNDPREPIVIEAITTITQSLTKKSSPS